MKRMTTMGAFGIFVLCAALGTMGCMTIVTQTVKKALEDRTTEDQITDTKIGSGILSRLSKKDKRLLLDVGVDVWEQRVLLTGTLDDPNAKTEVVRLVRADERIRSLYSEIHIVSKEDQVRRREELKQKEQEKEGLGQTVNDAWITTKIKAQLLAAKGVRSVNYRWRSVRKTVYLIGRARSEAELERVLEICRETKGVGTVKHFVEIKGP